MTCRPWQPTSVKNADRKALRVGPAPACDEARRTPAVPGPGKTTPSSEGHRHGGDRTRPAARICAPMLARPQVKLDSSRQAVSMRDIAEIEQLASARPARGRVRQHRIAREERREHDDVAEQEDPEAVADDDPLRRGAAGAMLRPVPGRRADAAIGCCVVAVSSASPRAGRQRRSRGARAARLARSIRATSSAGMMSSSWSRQAKTTKVAKAPTAADGRPATRCARSARSR